jgi:ryanodine receptor 2
MRTDYVPKPVDTSDVEIPEELKPLIEKMSENVHEVWSKTRIEQGWSYGKQRDDYKKHHPCLIPYDDLTEEEKVFDRNTSLETLKLIIKLGFKITKD